MVNFGLYYALFMFNEKHPNDALSPCFAGLVQDGDFKNVTPLSSSKTIPRLPFVTCLVKECKPNGLGDMQICIKVHMNTTITFVNATMFG